MQYNYWHAPVHASPATLLPTSGAAHTCLVTRCACCSCSAQDCAGGHCLQQHLHKAMHHCGGKLHTTTAPSSAGAHNNDQQKQQKASSAAPLLSGRLQLPGLQEEGVEGLDLQLPGVRLFALELAALQGSAQQLVARLEQQSVQELDQVRGCGDVWSCVALGIKAL